MRLTATGLHRRKRKMAEHKSKILVVDDNVSIGLVLKDGLEMHGFAVRYEARSTDAIKACLDFHPDLVFFDVDMPVKDGGQVAVELKGHPALQHTPVVFLTSLMSKEEESRQTSTGEIFLAKPIPIPELVARIRALLQPQMSRLGKTPHICPL